MNVNKCKDCGNFLQHYTIGNDKIFQVYCGHCTLTSPKRRKPDAVACEHFIQASQLEDKFVSKEYLTNALLQKVLDMELFPEVEKEK